MNMLRWLERIRRWASNPEDTGSNPVRSPKLRERVRIVQMDGCMAHVRANVREGVVIAFETRTLYGTSNPVWLAHVHLDNGHHTLLVAEPRLWSAHYDGVLEYHE